MSLLSISPECKERQIELSKQRVELYQEEARELNARLEAVLEDIKAEEENQRIWRGE